MNIPNIALIFSSLAVMVSQSWGSEAIPDGTHVQSLKAEPAAIELRSRYDYAQILVTARLSTGDSIDATRMVAWSVPDSLATINDHGFLEIKGDGEGAAIATLGSQSIEIPVKISGSQDEFKPDYVQDVNPVVSRMGCNMGTCHGSKDGKNGFKLSLRGYDPIYDLRSFTDDLASRRVNLASPDDSLMLLKATAAVPHEGGQLCKPGSPYYEIVRAWIADGVPYDKTSAKVKSITVVPQNPVVQEIGAMQQMRVVATFADGRQRDVTREAYVESGNIEVAAVMKDSPALVKVLRRGEAPVLVRFEGAYVATTITAMGDRTGFVWEETSAYNEIDRLVAAKWKRMKIRSSEVCNDYEFVRRVYLDLIGLPPTADQVQEFVADARHSQVKRNELIDRLIGTDDYVTYWTNKWADLLQVNRKFLGAEGARGFREWIRNEIANNTPYDEFCRKIITASGSNKEHPAASYYKILRTPEDTMENTTHLFLATRFNCNKCHDHPFERWTQDNYYEMAAYFARTDLKRDDASGDQNIGGTAVEGAKPLYEIVYDKAEGEMKHERTGQPQPPAFPYPAEHESEGSVSRREELAAWITSPDNRYFATSYVNRLWGYMLGTGVIEPLDDIRAGNPPSNPELLSWLTQQFIGSGFNTRHMLQLICKSRTYQLSVETNRWNEDDEINFSHGKARRLPAEVLYDTVYASLGAKANIPGVPEGTRAAALPDVGVGLPDNFLGNLGRPVRESACECERSSGLQLGPVMALISGPTVGNAISNPDNILEKLTEDYPDDKGLIGALFLQIVNRPATEDEIEASLEILDGIKQEHEMLTQELATYLAAIKPARDRMEAERLERIAAARQELASYEKELAPVLEQREKERLEKIAASKKALADRQNSVPGRLETFAASLVDQTRWQSLEPLATNASINSDLSHEGNGIIFVSGDNDRSSLTLETMTDLKSVAGVRLEALTDERLPKNGPGRADDGNFVLTEFETWWAPARSAGDWAFVKEWSFSSDADGWKVSQQAKLGSVDGQLTVTSEGNDPGLSTDVVAAPGEYILELTIQSPSREDAELFWSTDKGGFAPERSKRFPLVSGAPLRVQFSSADALTGLRLDPMARKGEVKIDSIKLFQATATEWQKVALQNAKATHSQGNFAVETAIDGKMDGANNGWAIAPKLGENHTATFEVKEPLTSDKGVRLRFVLHQQYDGKKWTLGKFRISATDAASPNFGIAADLADAAATPSGKRTIEQTVALFQHINQYDPELPKLRMAIAEAEKPIAPDPRLAQLKANLEEFSKPLAPDPKLVRLESDVKLSKEQLANRRLTGAQDLAWALINTPSFLFNR
ncbi:MAG: DUF1549 domain-containing protein [Verrucomicrobiales bacterium]